MANWHIINMRRTEVNGIPDVVVSIDWIADGTDGNGNWAEAEGRAVLDVDNLSANTLISFSELTEDRAIAWVKRAYTGDGVRALLAESDIDDAFEANLNQDLTNHLNDMTETGMSSPRKLNGTPW